MDTLGEPEVTQTVHIPLLKQLLCCVDAVVKTAGPLCSQHSEGIFTVLLRLQASSGGQQSLIEEVCKQVCICMRFMVFVSVTILAVLCTISLYQELSVSMCVCTWYILRNTL